MFTFVIFVVVIVDDDGVIDTVVCPLLESVGLVATNNRTVTSC